MLPSVEAGMACDCAERLLRMRSTLRHMRATRASWVEMGAASGVLASHLSWARLRRRCEGGLGTRAMWL